MGPDPREVAEEQQRADRLRRTVDVACALLRQARLTRKEAASVVAQARARALALFPGKDDVFDLVLAPRFRRILDERWPKARGRVLPFRPSFRGTPGVTGPEESAKVAGPSSPDAAGAPDERRPLPESDERRFARGDPGVASSGPGDPGAPATAAQPGLSPAPRFMAPGDPRFTRVVTRGDG